ncbi:hypothetical protein SADUNF_Sadunf18G0088000 [Salix dunnii]|uniref:Uncharacterized protein n=1 Tax=Salix dunnii TaxID=1413687 RepID=A0A835J556_9ROSI|nr:hypothetical protein SADUNF_Sadunf18G0088000 [Salix dunnii]
MLLKNSDADNFLRLSILFTLNICFFSSNNIFAPQPKNALLENKFMGARAPNFKDQVTGKGYEKNSVLADAVLNEAGIANESGGKQLGAIYEVALQRKAELMFQGTKPLCHAKKAVAVLSQHRQVLRAQHDE